MIILYLLSFLNLVCGFWWTATTTPSTTVTTTTTTHSTTHSSPLTTTDRTLLNTTTSSTVTTTIYSTDSTEIDSLIDSIISNFTATTEPSFPSGVTSEEFFFQDKILQHQFIIPGTKYCGPGNRSSAPDDLGRFKRVDKCCHDHDSCPDNIPAGKYKYGLHNNAKFTKSHCRCDETFHHCLKDVGTAPARLVGALYFTIFHINCFKKDHPVIECNRRRHRRCLEYKLNFSEAPVYQWFDNPFWRHWIDQFPPEMMNMTLLDMNASSTTPMNMIDSSENTTTTLTTEPTTTTENATAEVVSNNVSLENTTSAPYFGGYIQSVYDSITSYLYKWTYWNSKKEIEVTTISSVINSTANDLDYEDSSIEFYVLNN